MSAGSKIRAGKSLKTEPASIGYSAGWDDFGWDIGVSAGNDSIFNQMWVMSNNFGHIPE